MNEALIATIRQTTIPTVRLRRGYSPAQVDAFLEELCQALSQGLPVRDMIRLALFEPTHLRTGYHEDTVDDLLTHVEELAPG